MKIAVIGTSAGVGLETVKRALELLHEVFAVSRRNPPIPAHEKLTICRGNALDANFLKTVVKQSRWNYRHVGTREKYSKNNAFFGFYQNAFVDSFQTTYCGSRASSDRIWRRRKLFLRTVFRAFVFCNDFEKGLCRQSRDGKTNYCF